MQDRSRFARQSEAYVRKEQMKQIAKQLCYVCKKFDELTDH